MKPISEELFSKWVDQCLSPEEEVLVNDAVKENPELLAEVEECRALGVSLKEEFPASQEPPSPEFFNSHLMNQIARLSDEQAKSSSSRSAAPQAPWWSRIGMSWIPASALAAVLAYFAGTRANSPAAPAIVTSTSIPTVYTVEQKHDARVVANAKGEVALIVMDGLDAIGDEVDFATADLTTALPERYLVSLQRNDY